MPSVTFHRQTLRVDTPAPPPHWALLQRKILATASAACESFFAHYFDQRGYLLCVPRWGGDDGPDDAAENLLNWTMLHALGGSDRVLELYRLGWEGHLRQYTEARTVEVPMARDGMYYKEFPVMFDWFHHSEGLSAFTLQPLSEPHDAALVRRMIRYAGFYMGDEPGADNWDPEHRLIRSMFNGSRGPLLRKATGLDWAGDPIEIEGRFRLGHGEQSYQQMVDHFKDYNDVAGDHPLNLCATTLATNAYMLTGEERYRRWVLDYVDAWVERTAANDGIMPTNIGLDGSIGGACDGKWYGGVYGWGFSVEVPQTGEIAHRGQFHSRVPLAFGNALLLTGDQRYVDVWRGVLDAVNANGRTRDGAREYPRMHGDQGWYDYRPTPFAAGAPELWYWTLTAADLARIDSAEDRGWLEFLAGNDDSYPVASLEAALNELRQRMAAVSADRATPDTRLSDDMNHLTPAPAVTPALTRLMLGGLPTGRQGYPLHARLRYFDPERRRAGLPAAVGALVRRLSAESVTVTLANTDAVHERRLVVQGGAYGEHRLQEAAVLDHSGAAQERFALDHERPLTVSLAPSSVTTLELATARYARPPSCSMPWD